ncbi:HtaA domain-containing protein [Myceligenerans pegani]|uniref:HtaA domain-containing protein n=1 Tax=Myceligenerans pegani TaxID=2776917 RepID=A0ABR9MVA8_9MICO|nr:HtaA domain-containing protein [Myceligenerans sp. TRM 65318]MBE1875323.1 HtaA domain-containing protein [Myceligenerans sp. TRM 65318]MBE3017594.1 HtaA domain-containing protein [Myceligenerans sp. TRM 65318]
MHLDWGIKPSLLMYVAGAPGGRLAVGPEVGGEGASFWFGLDADRSAGLDGGGTTPDARAFAFSGSVAFFGHFGSFVGEIGDPEVRADAAGDDWTMSILDRESGVRTDAFRLVGAPEVVDGGRRLTWPHVEVSATGASLWGGNYPAGTRFEPVSIDLGEGPGEGPGA